MNLTRNVVLLVVGACLSCDESPAAPRTVCLIDLTVVPTQVQMAVGDSVTIRGLASSTCDQRATAVAWRLNNGQVADVRVLSDSTAVLTAKSRGTALLTVIERADTLNRGFSVVTVND